MENGISVIFVIPILIAIALISRNGANMFYTILACVAVALFCAVGAGGGGYGAIIGVSAFVIGVITLLMRLKHKKGWSQSLNGFLVLTSFVYRRRS
jgi:hypothetical protein